jgi:hypothetical protein
VIYSSVIHVKNLTLLKSKKPRLYGGISDICILDIETVNLHGDLKPYAIGFYSEDLWVYFYGIDCVEKMVQHFFTLNNTDIYIHNLDKFDSVYLLKKLLESKIDIEIIPSGSRMLGITSIVINLINLRGKKIKIN